MIKNIKNVAKVIFGKGAFEQLGDILKAKRKDSFMVFCVDDIFRKSELKNRLPLEKNDQLIFINVDDEPKTEKVDSLRDQILKITGQKPDGVIEIAEGVNIDTTSDGKLTGIEILQASKKININTILSYTLELDQNIFQKNIAEQGA